MSEGRQIRGEDEGRRTRMWEVLIIFQLYAKTDFGRSGKALNHSVCIGENAA